MKKQILEREYKIRKVKGRNNGCIFIQLVSLKKYIGKKAIVKVFVK